MTPKTWLDVFQGFFSREFVMALGAFLLGAALVYRREESETGLLLVMSSLGVYGVLRTGQKITEVTSAAGVEKAKAKNGGGKE